MSESDPEVEVFDTLLMGDMREVTFVVHEWLEAEDGEVERSAEG